MVQKVFLSSMFAGVLLSAGTLFSADSVCFVRLSEASCCEFLEENAGADVSEVVNHASKIVAQQEALCEILEEMGCEVDGQYCRLVNALRVHIPDELAEKISELPEVVNIQPVVAHERNLSSSVPFIGTAQAWGSASDLTGQGIRVGIIDSGIDYHHVNFGGAGLSAFNADDPTVIEPGSFPTSKVAGGFDFVGDDYNFENAATRTLVPDPDPLDPLENGHGTAVASIVGGLGVLSSGATYTGPYSTSTDFNQFTIAPGVSPDVSLYALKIFGREGTTNAVMDALEWAADPDGDLDMSDRLDVVNASLGSEFGFTSAGLVNVDLCEVAIQALSNLGCVVVVSAGNSSNTSFITGSPSTAASCISVASSLDGGLLRDSINILSPSELAGTLIVVDGAFTVPLVDAGQLTADVVSVEPRTACEPLTNASDLAGKIALIDRGGCSFVDKIERAQNAGAIAVIMVNRLDTNPFAMGGTPDYEVTIPGVMISREEGDRLREGLAAGLQIELGGQDPTLRPELGDTLSGLSSRGPSSGLIALKPEISAPGVEIVTASSGTGTGSQVDGGTSFAAPHVAGAAALMKEKNPSWSVENIKAALMNTTAPMRNEADERYPTTRAGSGRLQVDEAVATTLTAKAESDVGLVGLSFGAILTDVETTLTRNVVITNHSSSSVSGTISFDEIQTNDGVLISTTAPSFSIAGDSTATVPVTLTVDPARLSDWVDGTSERLVNGEPREFPLEVSGLIRFTTPTTAIHLPYYAAMKAVTNSQVGVSAITIPTSDTAEDFLLPLTGSSVGPISMLQLAGLDENQNVEAQTLGVADGIAIGVTSDFLTTQSIEDTTLYFGVVVAAPWTTPQTAISIMEVRIDTDENGTTDFFLTNSNQGSIRSNSINISGIANDLFRSVILDVATDEWREAGVINSLPGNLAASPPYFSNVIVLPVRASELGLTDANTTFNFFLDSFSSIELPNRLRDMSESFSYDLATEKLQASTGAADLPNHLLPVRLRNEASLPGDPTDSLLLLHHTNPSNLSFEAISIEDPVVFVDSDSDGMSDEFELANFGSTTAGQANLDSDGDGQSNLSEFQGGTDPNDAQSRLELMLETKGDDLLNLEFIPFEKRVFSLEMSPNLAADSFAPIWGDILGTGQPIQLPRPTMEREFFRLKVNPSN